MSKIPEYIKAVERPAKTEIRIVGDKYFVNFVSSQRNLVRKDGTIRKTPGKVTGHRIGTIELDHNKWMFFPNGWYCDYLRGIDGKKPEITDKEYGGSKVLYEELADIRYLLINIFGKKHADFLMCYSILKVLYHGVKADRLETRYEISYLSNLIKDVSLSKNTISNTLEEIGRNTSKFDEFMIGLLLDKNNLVIDGTLIDSKTFTNPLVQVGRKNKGVYTAQYNLVYIYDYIKKLPVYYKVFSGNTNDATAFRDVYRHLELNNSIIIGDKMFGTKYMRNKLTSDSILYLFPLKCSDEHFGKMIVNTKLKLKKVFINGCFYEIKQKRINKNKYLTYFKDLEMSNNKEKSYLTKLNDKQEGYSKKEFESIKDTFGVFVFETNKKYKPEKILEIYNLRWTIEEFNDEYKNDLELDNSNVTGVYRNYTHFFINHLAILLYCRLKNILKNSELNVSVCNLIEDLMDIRVEIKNSKFYIKNLPLRKKRIYQKMGLLL